MFEFILLVAAGCVVWYFWPRSEQKVETYRRPTAPDPVIVPEHKMTARERSRARKAAAAPVNTGPIYVEREREGSRTGDFVTGAVAGAVVGDLLSNSAARRRREAEEDESRARGRRYADDTPAWSTPAAKEESWSGSSGDSKPDTNSWFGGNGGSTGGGGVTDSWGGGDGGGDGGGGDGGGGDGGGGGD